MNTSRLLVITFALSMTLIGLDASAAGCLAITALDEHGSSTAKPFSAVAEANAQFALLLDKGYANSLKGDQVVEFRFYSPDGSLYESKAIAFSSEKSRVGKQANIPGYPFEVKVRGLKRVSGGNTIREAVTVELPVGGTLISSSSLYGTWKLEVSLNGERKGCARPLEFEIVP